MAGRFKIEEVREEFAKQGWTLLSDKYINLSTQMEMKCPKGHTVYMDFDTFRKKHICPVCARENLDLKENIERKGKSRGTFRTLALDQATHTSGWAVFDGTQLIKYGIFEADGTSGPQRIIKVKNYLLSLLDFWKPDKVILEDIQFQQYGRGATEGVTTFKVLAQLQGVLINALEENEIPYQVLHTGVWRKYCGVKGKTRSDKKRSAQLIVKEIYGVNATQDEADAICIGLCNVQKKEA